ncbi:SLBB domain-containing protein [Thalassotalea sp. G20_0]|uniref:SLBB domain-containing protein n=1 Tax=Thalassotalea sp. G20_0 TaxID=2821093 RepID=UPI001ADAD383|nr:SLBB domain-containing protein [Thalassotalea sp. G20_0]MBO9493324.1 SLBB domain-containing protein [Thalassotalea sp. G20_0]
MTTLYYKGICGRLLQTLAILLLLGVYSGGVSANAPIEKGGVFIIKLNDDGGTLPLLQVDEAMAITFPDGMILNFMGMDEEAASAEIHREAHESYNLESINYIAPTGLINIAILGDIQNPGKYPFPNDSLLTSLNSYHSFFDDTDVDADFTLIRSSQHIKVSAGKSAQWQLEADDAVLISLREKVREKTVDPQNQQGSDQEISPQSDLENNQSAGIEAPASVTPVNEEESIPEATEPELADPGVPDPEVADASDVEVDMSAVRKKDPVHYQLQSGDILVIGLPGEEGFNTNFLIGRDGTIHLPEIGQLKVAGLTLRAADKAIYTALSDVFLGLDKLTIHLREKRLLINVLGFVNEPGEVELPSTGNIQMAITEAGGFVDGAQLNKLQLRRDGKKTVFNFKRYLDTGDPSVLPEIKSLDEIFVPTSPGLSSVHGEPRVVDNKAVDSVSDRTVIKVFGEVIKPVSFPFEEGINVVDALLKGGGVTRYANVEQIRVLSGLEPKMFNLKQFLESGKDEDLPILDPGATIFVAQQVDSVSGGARKVYVMGQVQNPGAFETSEGVGFLDVIANSGGPTQYADIRSVRLLKSDGTVVPFNFQAFTEGRISGFPSIDSGDAVFFPEKGPESDQSWIKLKTSGSLKILGAIKKPGRYEWAPSVDFMDYLSNAGGPTNNADLAHVKIIRPGPNDERNVIEFNMQEFIEIGGAWSDMPELTGGTTIVIPELPENPTSNKSTWLKLPKENAIYLMGAVAKPGRFAFNEEMGFLDLISAAEGPSAEADLSKIRVIHRNKRAPKVSKLDLVRYFETGDDTLLPEVKPGDAIFFPSSERRWVEKDPEDTVRIMGAVYVAGRYDFTNNMTILDLLAEAQGPKETAYIEKILIVNSSCCENRSTTFDLMDFMKDPDPSRLPVLRAGDTVFVPELTQSYWHIIMERVADAATILTVIQFLWNLGWITP